MYAVVRTYSGQGAADVFDVIVRLQDEVRALFEEIPGFVGYTAVRSGNGGSTMSVCEDKAGTDETTRRAGAFLKDKMSGPLDPPSITEGEAVLQFGAATVPAV
ncbi:hypothetical protein [Amnibacterium sp.]|uniref:hypothetical protein n=1 Tax=Amnibacterium sp. TaxID=1872496 RepID=UPI00260C2866|nr:hypothetical protein [Amnibacterium sp.]MCU1473540.1 hypothetical protein [Amnibacterium sp.]